MLKAIAESLGVEVDSRFADCIENNNDEVSGDEIVLDIMQRAGLKGKEDECI